MRDICRRCLRKVEVYAHKCSRYLDPVAFKKTKHILRAAEFLRDLVARDVVRLQHLPGKVMIADLLTKAVARALFASLMDLIRQYAESGVACPST